MHPPRILGLVAGLVVLTACAPVVSPVVAPTPAATVLMCVPEFGGDPYPCSTAEFDQMKLRDAEYGRAEAAMRRLMELEVEAAVNSRTEPTDEALSLTDGPMREGLAKLYEINSGDQRRLEVTRVTRWPVRDDYKDRDKLHLALMVCITIHDDQASASAQEVDDDPLVVLFTEQNRVWLITKEDGTSCA